MASSRKLRTAHFFMFIGVTPLLFAGIVSIAGMATARSHPGEIGFSDGYLLIVLLLFGFVTTLIFGGAGALWSLFLTTRRIDVATRATIVLRRMVAAGLIIPLLWYGVAIFRLTHRLM